MQGQQAFEDGLVSMEQMSHLETDGLVRWSHPSFSEKAKSMEVGRYWG